MPAFLNCSVATCPNTTNHGAARFFAFPREPLLCLHWAIKCRRTDLLSVSPAKLSSNRKVCSSHFTARCMFQDGTRLLRHAIPTINLPNALEHSRWQSGRKRLLSDAEVKQLQDACDWFAGATVDSTRSLSAIVENLKKPPKSSVKKVPVNNSDDSDENNYPIESPCDSRTKGTHFVVYAEDLSKYKSMVACILEDRALPGLDCSPEERVEDEEQAEEIPNFMPQMEIHEIVKEEPLVPERESTIVPLDMEDSGSDVEIVEDDADDEDLLLLSAEKALQDKMEGFKQISLNKVVESVPLPPPNDSATKIGKDFPQADKETHFELIMELESSDGSESLDLCSSPASLEGVAESDVQLILNKTNNALGDMPADVPLDLLTSLAVVHRSAECGDPAAAFLLEQVRTFDLRSGEDWSPSTMQWCRRFRNVSSDGYSYVCKTGMLRLPTQQELDTSSEAPIQSGKRRQIQMERHSASLKGVAKRRATRRGK